MRKPGFLLSNTAHDIRTPLTLIKAPLEEMLENKTLNEAETNNMHMALRNVNSLLRMTTNLINFERAEVYSPHLYIAEYELNTYIKEIYNNFQTYATIKHITFRYESNFQLHECMVRQREDGLYPGKCHIQCSEVYSQKLAIYSFLFMT